MSKSFLRSIFKLNQGEGLKVLQFALLGAFLQAGISVGISTADTLFLSQVGADKLPYIYLLTPLVFLFYIPVYSYLMNRFGIDRVFDITMLVLIAGGIGLSLLLALSDSSVSYYVIYAAKLYSVLWYIGLYTLFWNFVDGYFDILDGKRLFSLLSAGSALGAALGGIFVTLLADYIKVYELFAAWSVIAVFTLPIVVRCRRRWKRLENEEPETGGGKGIIADTGSLLSTFRNSGFALLLGSTLFCTMIVTLICEYQYSAIFSRDYSEAELAKLFGILFFCVHTFNLVVNLFIFNRLVLLFGVRNMALVQPVCYIAAFVFFIVSDSFAAAVAGFFAYHGILTAIDYNNTNLLLNALPAERKKQLRTFIEGVCEPMANAVAGIFLIFFVAWLSPVQISSIGLAGSLVCLVLVLGMRTAYLTSMIANLKQGWLDFSVSLKSLLSGLPEDELVKLRERARYDSNREDEVLSAIEMLVVNNREAGLECLLDFIENTSAGSGPRVNRIMGSILSGQDNLIVQRVLVWLENTRVKPDAALLETLSRYGLVPVQKGLKLASSARPEEQAVSAVILRQSRDIFHMMKSLQVLSGLLGRDDTGRKAAIGAIGSLGVEEYAQFLVTFTKNPSPPVRKQALAAIDMLAGSDSCRIVPDLLLLLESAGHEERSLCLDIMSRIGDVNCIAPLLAMSERMSPSERRKIESIILGIGLKSIPSTLTILKDESYSYKARSIAARSVARQSFPQLESISQDLILDEIQRAYETICFRRILSQDSVPGAGTEVLRRFYSDTENAILEFVLELLTLSGRLANFELIAASLRSGSQKERGNAIETVQQACSRRMNHLLTPLLTAGNTDDKVKFYHGNYGERALSVNDVLEKAFASSFDLEASAAAQAIWEKGCAGGDREKSAAALKAKLQADTPGERSRVLLTDTLIGLMCRESGTGRGSDTTVIEKTACLSAVSFFGNFSAADLCYIAQTAKPVCLEETEIIYSAGNQDTRVFVLADGAVRLEEGGIARVLSSPAVFGEACLFGPGVREESAVSAGCYLLRIERDVLLDLARSDARVCRDLIGRKLGKAGALKQYRGAHSEPAKFSGAEISGEELR